MKSFPRSFWIIASVVLIINGIQASFTELLQDEAYYWYYAQKLEWGYFDHPPFVAFLALASRLLKNELGLRVLSVVLNLASYVLVFLSLNKQTRQKQQFNFWLILLSLPLINLYGFLTLPDTGTLFFASLFIYGYKAFLKDKPRAALLLGLAMAGLMYSKYTGVLLILATIASNLSLLRNPKAWLAVGISLALFAPHLGWLYTHDFITLKFHFRERPNHAYDFLNFTGLYLVNAIALFGLFAYAIFRALFQAPSQEKFSRGLVFMAAGVLLFFFLSSFEKKSQLQWLLPACYPALILLLERINKTAVYAFVKPLATMSLLLLFGLRMLLIAPQWSPIKLETHGVSKWAKQVASQASTSVVAFKDSYQKASLYAFYTRRPALSFNTLGYRPNAYDFDARWATLEGNPLTLIDDKAKTFTRIEHFQHVSAQYFDSFNDVLKLNLSDSQKLYAAVLDEYKNPIALIRIKTDINGKVLELSAQEEPLKNATSIRIGVQNEDHPVRLISLTSFHP